MLVLLATWILAGASAVQATSQTSEPEDGALAPRGCWPIAGGSAAGSGAAASLPVSAEPIVAWSFEAPGTIAAEPLVWNESVVLDTRTSRHAHTLHVLGTQDGRERSAISIPSELDLALCLWDGVVALRPATSRIELLRLVGQRLQPLRTLRTTQASAPLLFEDELYYADGAELVRQDIGEHEPRWRVRLEGIVLGSPRLAGEHVFVLWCDARAMAHLSSVTRAQGETVSAVAVGRFARLPDPEAAADLIVLEREVFALLPLAVQADGPESYTSARVGRRGGLLGDAAGGSSLHAFRCAPAVRDPGWIALDASSGEAPRWLASFTDGAETKSIVLADAQDHPGLLECRAPLALAGGVYYFDDLAVDAADLRVLWKSGHRPRLRPVAGQGAVLIVEGESRLIALRAPSEPRDPSAEEAARLLRRHDAELGEGLAALALRAVKSEARALAASLCAEAERRGASEHALRRAADALERPGRPRTRHDARAEETLVAERERLLATHRARILELARGAREGALAGALIAALVAEAPDDPSVGAALRALLPADAPLVEPFDARSWLEFRSIASHIPVRFVPPAKDAPERSGEAILERETRAWRDDLFGFATERLFLVTPPSRPGAVARCLQVGELVCDALEDLFGGRGPAGPEPLVLLLYETEREYFDQSQREQSKPELARGWSGGHFSPQERLSRMFVPTEDERSERLLGVYAHELAHHWLAARSPFAGAQWRARTDQRGYWIAEGFATMVEEWRFLPEQGRWEHENPRAESLDTVANATGEQLLPWSEIFALTQEQFLKLDEQATHSIPLSWRLGARARVSPLRIFYAQAGAACHYLLQAEDGRHRTALLLAIEAWSTGRPIGVQELFGAEPDELGRRIVAFAREATMRE